MSLKRTKKQSKKDTESNKLSKKEMLSGLADKMSAEMLSADSVSSIVKHYIHTGCTLLDNAIGYGGWPSGRVSNIIGDSSTGKTDLSAEAVAYCQNVLGGICIYDDPEHTLEASRAKVYGVIVDEVIRPASKTVEDFYDNVCNAIDMSRKNPDVPILYILDSLDSLSDEAEKTRDMRKGTFGTKKAAAMSQFFRRICGDLAETNVTLIIISQTRDNIGVTFGRKWTVSGGNALKFYASCRVVLAEIRKVKHGKEDRIVGIDVRAQVIKNKVSSPFLTVEFPILFEMGIDNVGSSIDWLYDYTDELGTSQGYYKWDGKSFRRNELIKFIESNNLEKNLSKLIKKHWSIVNPKNVFNRKPKYSTCDTISEENNEKIRRGRKKEN